MSLERKYLFLRSIFGVNKSVKKNVHFIPISSQTQHEQGDQVLMAYVSGNVLVLNNPNSKRNFFIEPGENCQGITTVKLTPDKRFLVLGCRSRILEEESATRSRAPFMKFYDVKSYRECKTIVAHPELGSREIICIDRSEDNKILIAQGGAPSYRIAVYTFTDALRVRRSSCLANVIQKVKSSNQSNQTQTISTVGSSTNLASTVRLGIQSYTNQDKSVQVHHTSLNGKNLLCVTGTDLLKIFKIDDVTGKITLLKKDFSDFPPTEQSGQIFVTHLWLTDTRLLVGNHVGNLYILEDLEFKCMLNSSPSNNLSINCIISYERGFLLGQEDGQVLLYERADFDTVHEGMYKKQKNIKLPNEDDFLSPDDLTVLHMDYDPLNANLAVMTRAGHIFCLQMTGSALKSMEEGDIEINAVFHTREITGVDCALKKPLIVTCSLDRSVRIWNYHTRELELMKVFQMEAHSVAIHPSGYYLLVGFTDKLRFFKILGTQLKEETSFPIRGCCEVKFSNGGQFLAATHGTSIHVYCSFTYEHRFSLRNAHTSKVSSLFWSENDTHITSVDIAGTVVEYQLRSETKDWDHSMPDVQLNCVVANPKSTFVVGNDSKIHIFVEQVPLTEYRVERPYASLALCGRMKLLFAGRIDGAIFCYNQTNLYNQKDVIFPHSDLVSRFVVTHQGRLLVSISRDGSMSVFDIFEKDRSELPSNTSIRASHHTLKPIVDVNSLLTSSDSGGRSDGGMFEMESDIWDDEILIDKVDLHAKVDMIREYENKCHELKTESEYTQVKKKMDFENRLQKQTEDFGREMAKRTSRIEELKKEISEKVKKHEMEKHEREELHRKELQDLDSQYKERIASTMNNIKDLATRKEHECRLLLERSLDQRKFHAASKDRILQRHVEEIEDLEEKKKKLEEERGRMQEVNEQLVEAAKLGHNEYLDRIEEEYIRKLRSAEKRNKALKEKNEKKRKKESNNFQREKNLQDDINRRKAQLKRKKEEYVQKERETNSIMNENKEREETIREKDRRIHQLNKQNKELKKFKYVLNYKIETLQDEINPNHQTIEQLEMELKKYDKELQQYRVEKKRYDSRIKELEGKIRGNEVELRKIYKELEEMEAYRTRIASDIHDVVVAKKALSDPKVLKREMVEFYHLHAAPPSIMKKNRNMDMDIQKEIDRKRTHLEKTVRGLKRKLLKGEKTTKQETQRIIHENVLLINEVNQLKKELRYLNRKLHERSDNKRKRRGGGGYRRSSAFMDDQGDQGGSRFPPIGGTRQGSMGGPGEAGKVKVGGREVSLGNQLDLMKNRREMQILQVETLKKQLEELKVEKERGSSRGSSRASSRGLSTGDGRRSGRSSRSGGGSRRRRRRLGSRGDYEDI